MSDMADFTHGTLDLVQRAQSEISNAESAAAVERALEKWTGPEGLITKRIGELKSRRDFHYRGQSALGTLELAIYKITEQADEKKSEFGEI